MHIRIIKIKCLNRISISRYSHLPLNLKRIRYFCVFLARKYRCLFGSGLIGLGGRGFVRAVLSSAARHNIFSRLPFRWDNMLIPGLALHASCRNILFGALDMSMTVI